MPGDSAVPILADRRAAVQSPRAKRRALVERLPGSGDAGSRRKRAKSGQRTGFTCCQGL